MTLEEHLTYLLIVWVVLVFALSSYAAIGDYRRRRRSVVQLVPAPRRRRNRVRDLHNLVNMWMFIDWGVDEEGNHWEKDAETSSWRIRPHGRTNTLNHVEDRRLRRPR